MERPCALLRAAVEKVRAELEREGGDELDRADALPLLDIISAAVQDAVRGGVLQNIFMRNVNVGLVKDSVLQIDFLYEEGAKGEFNPVARNVVMENIKVAQTPRVLNVRGFPAADISGVRIYNSTFKQVKNPDVVLNADVKLAGCSLEPAK